MPSSKHVTLALESWGSRLRRTYTAIPERPIPSVRPHPETMLSRPVRIVRWAARYLAQRYELEPVTPDMLAEIDRTIEEA